MKYAILFLLLAGFTLGLKTADAASRTRGYLKSNGAYVQPYYRSTPDSYKFNNYSSQGSYNPFTGKKGYKSWY
jgi:hypothetical protein